MLPGYIRKILYRFRYFLYQLKSKTEALTESVSGNITGKGPGLKQVCLRSGQPAVCGFLTSCRKDFTTQAQVILSMHLLKLGQ